MSQKLRRQKRDATDNTSVEPTPGAQETSRAAGGSRRHPAPAELTGATAFGADADVRNSGWLFEAVRVAPWRHEVFRPSL